MRPTPDRARRNSIVDNVSKAFSAPLPPGVIGTNFEMTMGTSTLRTYQCVVLFCQYRRKRCIGYRGLRLEGKEVPVARRSRQAQQQESSGASLRYL